MVNQRAAVVGATAHAVASAAVMPGPVGKPESLLEPGVGICALIVLVRVNEDHGLLVLEGQYASL